MSNLQGLQLVSHPNSPLFAEDDWRLKFHHALEEITSQNMATGNAEVREILRQLGFCNLWFFLKYIAGYNGPYSDLTDHLHMEMSNFYQWQMSTPGSRAAGLVPRSFYKSTDWTHGADSWELLRNPNLRIALVSGKSERAEMFMQITQRTFDDNELVEWLYPEFYVKNPASRRGWSDKRLVMPNRTVNHPEPSIQLVTAGGSSQGIHAELLKIDDIVGDDELDSERSAGAEMMRRTNWLKSNSRTLLLNWRTSRIFVVGTRYGIEDPYEHIMQSLKWCTPAVEELPYEVDPEKGLWSVYYRLIKEDGQIVFPENFTEKGLQELYEEDPWTYWTQYYNNPHKAQSSDMSMYTVKTCQLDHVHEEPVIVLHEASEEVIYLADCDLIQCIDPAASEAQTRASTSRSALLCMATDHKGRHFFVQGHAGFVDTFKIWDWAVQGIRMFGHRLRMTGLERKGAFKLLTPLFRRWQQQFDVSLRLRDVPTAGDKDARIRSFLQGPLVRGEVYAVEQVQQLLQQELDMFPGSKKKDVLDAAAMCMQMKIQPNEPKRRGEFLRMLREEARPTSAVTGY